MFLEALYFLANRRSHNWLQFQAIQRMDFWRRSRKGKRKERLLFNFCLEKSGVAVGSGMLICKKCTVSWLFWNMATSRASTWVVVALQLTGFQMRGIHNFNLQNHTKFRLHITLKMQQAQYLSKLSFSPERVILLHMAWPLPLGFLVSAVL